MSSVTFIKRDEGVFIKVEEIEYGPFIREEVREFLRRGSILVDDQVPEEIREWLRTDRHLIADLAISENNTPVISEKNPRVLDNNIDWAAGTKFVKSVGSVVARTAVASTLWSAIRGTAKAAWNSGSSATESVPLDIVDENSNPVDGGDITTRITTFFSELFSDG